MDKLKPLGSEKLQGDEKLQRILQLTYFNEVRKTTTNNQKPEYITETENGVYGITKEKDGYYVKKGLNEDTLDYIGGLFMKNKNKFSSYAEAFKRLDLLKGQEQLQEETRYVLKTKKPAPAPVPEPVSQEVPPEDTTGGDTFGSEDLPPVDNMGGEDTSMDDPSMNDSEESGFKGVQKLTGKLGEKIREASEEMESEDIKFVLNSIISAIDLGKLDDEDKEDILSNLEGGGGEDDTMGSEDFETGDQELPDDLADEGLNELDAEPGDDGEWPFPEFDLDEDDLNFDNGEEMELNPEDELNKIGGKKKSSYLDARAAENEYPDDYSGLSDEEIEKMERDELGGEEDETKEFNLEELTSIVNKAINDNLKNYFQ